MVSERTQFWIRASLVCAVVGILFYVLPLAMPFVLSIVLSVLLAPMVDRLHDALKARTHWDTMPRWIPILISFVLLTLVTVLLISYIVIPFVAQLLGFMNNVPTMLGQFMIVVTSLQEEYLYLNLPAQITHIINETVTRVGNYSVDLAQKLISFAFSLAGFLIELLLVPILTFYMLKDGRPLMYKMLSLFAVKEGESIHRLLKQTFYMLSGYVQGQLFLAINMFVIVLCGMYAFDLPYPLVLATIAGLAEWIPIVGPIMGAVPAIILASTVSLPLAVKVAVFYAIIQLIDGQVIMPKVFGRVIPLPPIVILGVIFCAGSLYGVKGMMLAVPVTAVAQIIAKELWYYNERRKGDSQ